MECSLNITSESRRDFNSLGGLGLVKFALKEAHGCLKA